MNLLNWLRRGLPYTQAEIDVQIDAIEKLHKIVCEPRNYSPKLVNELQDNIDIMNRVLTFMLGKQAKAIDRIGS